MQVTSKEADDVSAFVTVQSECTTLAAANANMTEQLGSDWIWRLIRQPAPLVISGATVAQVLVPTRDEHMQRWSPRYEKTPYCHILEHRE